MTVFFFGIAFLLSISGTFYALSRKKKLSDEQIIEFEKTIKPNLVKLALLSVTPLLLLCFYILTEPEHYNARYIIYSGLAFTTLEVFGYVRLRRIIGFSSAPSFFKYALSYFIFTAVAQLSLLSGITYSLKDYMTL